MAAYTDYDVETEERVYDEESVELLLERRREARRQRAIQRRRQQRVRAAAFLFGLVLIAAMVAVIAHRKPAQSAENTQQPPENTQTQEPENTANEQMPSGQQYAELYSPLDADGDGVDDYHDIMLGARAYIATNPIYESKYYGGGYPDDGRGVCTDVIWQAFRAAGYELKDLVDADVQANRSRYDNIDTVDPNIDFRRVSTLDRFFAAHAQVLTNSFDDPSQWQPGDIVVFGDTEHIAICSDKRNVMGLPYIIHHGTLEEGPVEVDAIFRHPVSGHYRWCPES